MPAFPSQSQHERFPKIHLCQILECEYNFLFTRPPEGFKEADKNFCDGGGGGAINNAHLKDLITQSVRAFSLHHNPSAIQKITVKT